MRCASPPRRLLGARMLACLVEGLLAVNNWHHLTALVLGRGVLPVRCMQFQSGHHTTPYASKMTSMIRAKSHSLHYYAMCTTGAIAGGAGIDRSSNFAHAVAAATTSAAAAIPPHRAAGAASSSPQRALSYFVGAATSPIAGRADRGNARFCGSMRATTHQITSAATSFRCQVLSLSQLRIGSSRDSSGMTSRYAAASASGTVAGSSTNDSSGAGVGGGGGGAPMPKPGSAWMDRTVRVPGSVPNPSGPLAGRSFILKDIYDVRICSV